MCLVHQASFMNWFQVRRVDLLGKSDLACVTCFDMPQYVIQIALAFLYPVTCVVSTAVLLVTSSTCCQFCCWQTFRWLCPIFISNQDCFACRTECQYECMAAYEPATACLGSTCLLAAESWGQQAVCAACSQHTGLLC